MGELDEWRIVIDSPQAAFLEGLPYALGASGEKDESTQVGHSTHTAPLLRVATLQPVAPGGCAPVGLPLVACRAAGLWW